MVRRKLTRNLQRASKSPKKRDDANTTTDGATNAATANHTGETYPSSNDATNPPREPMVGLQRYRSLLLIILAWCTIQMYTDSLSVQWSSFWANYSSTTAWSGSSSSSSSKRRPVGELRFDWANLKPQTQVGKLLAAQRSDCSQPLKYHSFGEGGLGAELHAYSYSMCWSYQYKWRLYSTHNMYYDKEACGKLPDTVSQMNCYFGNLELTCEGDEKTAKEQLSSLKKADYHVNYWNLWKDKQHDNICQALATETGVNDHIEMRSGVIEALFTAGISPTLLKEAQRQHKLVFPKGAPPAHQLITVHVRWGDKKNEMKLVTMTEYVESIRKIASYRRLQEVHVYLGTEDPAAVRAFQQAMDPSWHLYVDQFYLDMLPHRNNKTQEVAGVAKKGLGNTGLLALGSLLVALEADHYVLTSASNWSRLINELRRSIVKNNGCPKPGEDCTTVVDLRKANFWMDLNIDGGGV